MKKLLTAALAAAAVIGAGAQEQPDTVKGFCFKDVKINPTTSVKDQNKSGTCWAFSTTSFLEDELLH